MFDQSRNLLKESKGIIAKAVEIEVKQEKDEDDYEPVVTNDMLEDFLVSFIRIRASWIVRPTMANPQGGYRKQAANLNETAQDIYDNIMMRLPDEDPKSKLLVRAVKVVKNFSEAYVKKVIEKQRNIMSPEY